MDLNEITLTPGYHEADSGEYCMMEAAAEYSGLPWTDEPETVNDDIARLCRAINDWIEGDVQRQRLKDLIPLVTMTGGFYSEYVHDQVTAQFKYRPEFEEYEFVAPADPIAFLNDMIDRALYEIDMMEGAEFAVSDGVS